MANEQIMPTTGTMGPFFWAGPLDQPEPEPCTSFTTEESVVGKAPGESVGSHRNRLKRAGRADIFNAEAGYMEFLSDPPF